MKPSLLIVGLGNPGKQYEGTRHNVGFLALDILTQEFGTSEWADKQKFLSYLAEGRIVTVPILLAKPTTFMNNSGNAVKKLVDFYKLDPTKQLLILCDDIDQRVGEIRLNESGSPGTHNGLRSIESIFGEEFPRLRIGIRGPEAPQGSFQKAGEDLSAYVLSRASKEEQVKINEAIQEIPKTVREFVLEEKYP